MPSERYPDVDQHPKFPDIERSIIEAWKAEHTFEQSVEQRPADDEFVFYDGPPFANGLPHYGHLLTGFVKDAVPRYKTMRGQRVERRFGWDCHGLPIEMQAEKELRVTGQGDRGVRRRSVQRALSLDRGHHRGRVARLRHPVGALGRHG